MRRINTIPKPTKCHLSVCLSVTVSCCCCCCWCCYYRVKNIFWDCIKLRIFRTIDNTISMTTLWHVLLFEFRIVENHDKWISHAHTHTHQQNTFGLFKCSRHLLNADNDSSAWFPFTPATCDSNRFDSGNIPSFDLPPPICQSGCWRNTITKLSQLGLRVECASAVFRVDRSDSVTCSSG